MSYEKIFKEKLDQAITYFADAKSNCKKDLRNYCEVKFVDTLEEKIDALLNIPNLNRTIKELKYKLSREDLVLQICKDFLQGKFGKLQNIKLIELAVRVSVAILTDGVVSAPLEGISKITEQVNIDNTKYVEIYYAGPIRGAGGTAQVYSILTAEYLARKLGYNRYIASEDEKERYVVEILKYMKIYPRIRIPSPSEIKTAVENTFICITGVATELIEVDSYKYLPNVKTPRIRGGMCLVIVDGIILKAAKLLKAAKMFQNLDWQWLRPFTIKSNLNISENIELEKKFIQTLSIGKPVLSISKQPNGFRLRIGRSRNTGLGTAGINPFTMKILKFLNVGTQLITEFPGKALGVAPNSELEPCKIKTTFGEFLAINTYTQYEKYKNQIEEIVDLGEILISLGDFVEANYQIPKLDWCTELWNKQLSKNKLTFEFNEDTTQKELIDFCDKNELIIHPKLHPLVDFITYEDYLYARNSLLNNSIDSRTINILETLGIEYFVNLKFKYPLTLNWFFLLNKEIDIHIYSDIKELINKYSNIKIFRKGNNLIDCRTGRVESAIETHTKPKIHGIYEISSSKLSTNILNKVLEKRSILKLNLRARYCIICTTKTYKPFCCNESTRYIKAITNNDNIEFVENIETDAFKLETFDIDVYQDFSEAFQNLNQIINSNIKVSNKTIEKIYELEPIEKIILRSKYDISCWKDGTSRFTFSNLTLTHFTPKEIHISIEKLIELGYVYDIYKQLIVNENQIIELKPQDVVINLKSLSHFYKITKFIDELLVKFYNKSTFYNLKIPSDIIGEYFVGLSPHTCVGVTCRVIGYTNANVLYAHPIFHAAKRRNCDGDGDILMLLGDCLLNFSHAHTRQGNGAKMNIPISISKQLYISEIDKEARNLDFYFEYTDEIYEYGINNKNLQLLGTKYDDEIYNLNLGFTLNTNTISLDTTYNAYKDIQNTEEKLNEQFRLCKSIRNLKNQTIVFDKVLKTHLIPDLVGNIRSYLKQNFRCSKCKISYRAPTFSGCCNICNKPLLQTVYENSVKKYLPYIENILKEYKLDLFTLQKIELFKLELHELFQDKSKNSLLRYKK